MPVSLLTGYNLDDPALVSVLDELPFWSAPFGIRLLEKIIPEKNMNVLDIGSGTGFPLTELAMRLGDTCRVYGLDPWKAAADRIKRKISAFGITNIELLDGVAENIPLPDSHIDLVTSNNGLNNVKDPDASISECARVLKPGGRLIFTMNLDSTMKEFYDVLISVLKNHGLNDAIKSVYEHIYMKRKPLDEVTAMLQKHGFLEISTEKDVFTYRFTDGTTLFRHFFIRLAFLDAWKKIVPEDKQEMVFNEIEKKINQKAQKEGFFRLSVPFVVIEVIKN